MTQRSISGLRYCLAASSLVVFLSSGTSVQGLSQDPQSTEGWSPATALTLGKDGNFYGTTVFGGANGKGTVFKVTPDGVVTTLHSFATTNGDHPIPALTLGRDGNLYGTTCVRPPRPGGTIYKITPSGTFTTLAEGINAGELAVGPDANLYGCTFDGGAGREGTVFKITPDGTLTLLHTFSGPDGSTPAHPLTLGADGVFYGTTKYGGSANHGTIFKITPTGAFTLLHSFNAWEGSTQAPLTLSKDGNLYGATYGDHRQVPTKVGEITFRWDLGKLFKITPTGALTILHVFGSKEGSYARQGLTLHQDGDIYGTTPDGGAYGWGTVFKMTQDGNLTTLSSFANPVGVNDRLTLGRDGNFYATTTGGAYGYGTVFKITPQGSMTLLHSFGKGHGTKMDVVN